MQLPEPPERSSNRSGILLLWGVAGGMLLAWLFVKLFGAPATPPTAASQPSSTVAPPEKLIPLTAEPANEYQFGQQRAQQFCGSCHDLPSPRVLDKTTWAMEVLPEMAKWLGMSEIPYEAIPLEPRIAAANIVPRAPMMSVEEWRAICTYYLGDAPVEAAPQPARPPIQMPMKQFDVFRPSFQATQAVTMVKIDPPNKRVFVGVEGVNLLYIVADNGRMIASADFASAPVGLNFDQRGGMHALLIGRYLPSDIPVGELVHLGPPRADGGGTVQLLKELQRPVDMAFGDLNGDGREDVLIASYGHLLGELSWFEATADGKFLERVVFERPGCIAVDLHDLNGDGAKDIIALFAQAREGLFIFMNDGKGNFTPKPIVENHSAWGYSHCEVVDFNQDGFLDIFTTNGDNGDNTGHLPPMKSFHGIRLYLNDGKNNFKESWFFPMNGAYKSLARDFDGDGDLDIAAISFYPDYRRSPRESFLYLENKGDMKFDVFSFEEAFSGRWLCMDAGDIDADGDLDVVLGSFIAAPTYVPHLLRDKWERDGPTVLYLRNTWKRGQSETPK